MFTLLKKFTWGKVKYNKYRSTRKLIFGKKTIKRDAALLLVKARVCLREKPWGANRILQKSGPSRNMVWKWLVSQSMFSICALRSERRVKGVLCVRLHCDDFLVWSFMAQNENCLFYPGFHIGHRQVIQSSALSSWIKCKQEYILGDKVEKIVIS